MRLDNFDFSVLFVRRFGCCALPILFLGNEVDVEIPVTGGVLPLPFSLHLGVLPDFVTAVLDVGLDFVFHICALHLFR